MSPLSESIHSSSKNDDFKIYPLTSLQIRGIPSHLSTLSIHVSKELGKIIFFVDNAPWATAVQKSKSSKLWHLMTANSPFCNQKESLRVKNMMSILEEQEYNNLEKKFSSIIDAMSRLSYSKLARVVSPNRRMKLRSLTSFLRRLHAKRKALSLLQLPPSGLYGCVTFEVKWKDVRGIQYSNELQVDTYLALEVKSIQKREFSTFDQAKSFHQNLLKSPEGNHLKTTESSESGVQISPNITLPRFLSASSRKLPTVDPSSFSCSDSDSEYSSCVDSDSGWTTSEEDDSARKPSASCGPYLTYDLTSEAYDIEDRKKERKERKERRANRERNKSFFSSFNRFRTKETVDELGEEEEGEEEEGSEEEVAEGEESKEKLLKRNSFIDLLEGISWVMSSTEDAKKGNESSPFHPIPHHDLCMRACDNHLYSTLLDPSEATSACSSFSSASTSSFPSSLSSSPFLSPCSYSCPSPSISSSSLSSSSNVECFHPFDNHLLDDKGEECYMESSLNMFASSSSSEVTVASKKASMDASSPMKLRRRTRRKDFISFHSNTEVKEKRFSMDAIPPFPCELLHKDEKIRKLKARMEKEAEEGEDEKEMEEEKKGEVSKHVVNEKGEEEMGMRRREGDSQIHEGDRITKENEDWKDASSYDSPSPFPPPASFFLPEKDAKDVFLDTKPSPSPNPSPSLSYSEADSSVFSFLKTKFFLSSDSSDSDTSFAPCCLEITPPTPSPSSPSSSLPLPSSSPSKPTPSLSSSSPSPSQTHSLTQSHVSEEWRLNLIRSFQSPSSSLSDFMEMKDGLIVCRFNDHTLPSELHPILTSNPRLLKMLESGLPPWSILLQSFSFTRPFYHPVLRPLVTYVCLLLSLFSLLIGFYDLYKNLPIVREAISLLLPSSPFLSCIESWEVSHRLKYLITILFLQNWKRAFQFMSVLLSHVRSFADVFVRPLLCPLSEFVCLFRPFLQLGLNSLLSFLLLFGDGVRRMQLALVTFFSFFAFLLSLLFSPVLRFLLLLNSLLIAIVYPLFKFFSFLFQIPFNVLSSLLSSFFSLLRLLHQTLLLTFQMLHSLSMFILQCPLLFSFSKTNSASTATTKTAAAAATAISHSLNVWKELNSKVFKAVHCIFRGLVSFFLTCNRHRVSIYYQYLSRWKYLRSKCAETYAKIIHTSNDALKQWMKPSLLAHSLHLSYSRLSYSPKSSSMAMSNDDVDMDMASPNDVYDFVLE